MSDHTAPPAGWYPDPQGTGSERWWNGLAWTATSRPVAAQVSTPEPSASPTYALPPQAYRVEQPAVSPFYTVAPFDPSRTAIAHGATPYSAPRVDTMAGAIRAVFSRYAAFEGRAGRGEFWYWMLFHLIVTLAAVALIIPSFLFGVTAIFGVLIYLALIGWSLAVLIPTYAVMVRRLRDAGYPWALILLCLVPLGTIAVYVLCAQPSRYV